MLIYILLIFLLILLYIVYRSMGKDLISPAFLFTAPFCVAVLCAALYADKWSLSLSLNTFLVVFIGCLSYILTCILIHYSYGKNKLKRARKVKNESVPIASKAWKIIVVILIQVISLLVVIRSMRSSLSRYGISGNLNVIMYYYRSYSMFSDYNVGISNLAINLRVFSIAVSYMWAYIIANNIAGKFKVRNFLLMLVSYILGIFNSVILGARGEAIQLIIAFVVFYMVFQRKYNNWKVNIKFKHIVLMLAIVAGILITFKASGDILGRNAVVANTTTAMDEVAKYLGAEIKNLDLFINEYKKSRQIWGSQTFGVLLNWLDTKYSLGWNIQSMLSFRRVNGISMGNVYTTFGPFVYDFGYFGGAVVMPVICACIVQLLYEKILSGKWKTFNYIIILNSYILFLETFSFFGERLFSSILNLSFYRYLISWWIAIMFIGGFKIGDKKIVFKKNYAGGKSR